MAHTGAYDGAYRMMASADKVSLHGWDTQSGNSTATPDLCAQLDTGLATLVNDLHECGMLSDTLVVLTTEFGRSPKINMSLGRDHYPKAFSAAMFGGFDFGTTNKTAEAVEKDEITIPDFNATIGQAFGLKHFLRYCARPDRQSPLRAAQAQGRQLGQPGAHAKRHTASGQRRCRALAV